MKTNKFQPDADEPSVQMQKTPVWTNASGKHSEIVLSSKIKLSRNLKQFKFLLRATQLETVQIFDFITTNSNLPIYALSKLSPIDREKLVERNITECNFLEDMEGKGIGLWDNESFNVVINEEEHIQIQHITSGLNLESAYREIDKVDNNLSDSLPYAFSPIFGFLTASPNNTGTALKVSARLHLPGLVHSEKLKKVLDKLNQIGFLVKPVSGEGTKIEGNLLEIENRITLGKKENELIKGLENTVSEIVENEKEARDILLKNAKLQLEDKIWRAYAILKSAHMLTLEEFFNFSSAVRLGVGIGLLKDVNLQTLNNLMIYVQPAHLKENISKHLSRENYNIDTAVEIDSYRAKYVRECISKN